MIQVYDTEQRKKVPFETREPGKVNMYVCGPTVYDACHVGHARPAVVFDTIRRYLEYAGYVVQYISNITDIDDKIIQRANELGITTRALSSRYQDEYEQDMAALGVRSPTVRPKATEHIPEMLELIKGLEEKDIAYTTERGVWFDISKFADYGRMSGRKQDDEETEHRVEQDPEKRNSQDFALWKFSKPGEPRWPSPWGDGRPGWHIECSVMSGKFSEFQLDIHAGGSDLIFPHHENEIAQSEAYSGKRFVRYWLHNGFITVGKEEDEDDGGIKMGKSKGNAFWLREAFKITPPASLRLWILGTHYRAPLMYKPSSLKSAESQLERIYNSLESLEEKLENQKLENIADAAEHELTKGAVADFRKAMDDDFNSPQALAALHELIGVANKTVAEDTRSVDLAVVRNGIHGFLSVLGLPYSRPVKAGGTVPEELIDTLVEVRNQARADKNFSLSDKIRDGLAEMDIVIRDGKEGTTWKSK